MAQGKFRPENDYLAVLERMIEHCGGVNEEQRTSSAICSEALGVSQSVVADLRKVAERTGGMTSRYEGGPKGEGGRRAYWKFVHDHLWIQAQAKKQFGIKLTAYDIEHKMPRDYRYNQAQRTKPIPADAPPPIKGSPDPRPTRHFEPDAEGVMTPANQIPVKETGETAEPTDMEAKMRAAGFTRKDEPKALIEAARQYMGREDFIAEELKRFAAMGITIDESAIKVEKDPVLEAVAALVPAWDRLTSTVDRQAESLRTVQPTGALQDKVNQYKADLEEARDQTRKVQHAYDEWKSYNKRKMQEKDRRIQELEKELQHAATQHIQNIAQAH